VSNPGYYFQDEKKFKVCAVLSVISLLISSREENDCFISTYVIRRIDKIGRVMDH
jgi:hypothetical protein